MGKTEEHMFEKILVPLDGSEMAVETLCQVEDLARAHEGEIMLLKVAFVHSFPGADIKKLEEKAIQRSQDYLDKIAEDLGKKGLKCSVHVRYGDAAEEILDHAKRYASAVVMTTHGRGGMLRWAMGSTSDRVVRRCTKPVLLIRPEKSCQTV
jgi:nucleotide-binding universal stress UspA family protein